MGLKEKFMEGMMNKMSAEEKRQTMREMMDSFFSGMSAEEKRLMMKEMMPLMMSQMMGSMMGGMGGRGHSRGRHGDATGHEKEKGEPEAEGAGFNPMEMCRRMMGGMGRENAGPATAEVNGLFEEWANQMDEEILGLLDGGASVDIDRLAAQLKISKESLIYFLARLARQGKVTLKPECVTSG